MLFFCCLIQAFMRRSGLLCVRSVPGFIVPVHKQASLGVSPMSPVIANVGLSFDGRWLAILFPCLFCLELVPFYSNSGLFLKRQLSSRRCCPIPVCPTISRTSLAPPSPLPSTASTPRSQLYLEHLPGHT